MEFKQLEIYVKLVEVKSFSEAAKALNISQPTVSMVIKNLEKDLNSKLIIRSTREIELSTKGEILYNKAKKLLKERDDIIEEFKGLHKKNIKIGASSVPAEYLLGGYLKEFKEKHGDIHTFVYESNSKSVIEKVKNHKLDVGFVGMKEDIKNINFYPIYQDKLVYIAPKDPYYTKLIAEKPPIKRLLQEPLILREEGSATNELLKKLVEDLHVDYQDLKISLRANTIDLIKNMVRDKLGSAFISEISIKDINKNDFIVYDLDVDTSRKFYFIYHKTYEENSAIESFIDFITNRK